MKFFIIILAVLFLSSLFSFTNGTSSSPTPPIVVSLPNPLNISTIGELVEKITGFLRIVAYAVAPIAIVVAGYYFLTSAGDPNKVSIAKKIFIWTLAGVLIVTAADILVQIIKEDVAGVITP